MKNNCEKSQKRNLITRWAIRNVPELGMEETQKQMKRLFKMSIAELKNELKA